MKIDVRKRLDEGVEIIELFLVDIKPEIKLGPITKEECKELAAWFLACSSTVATTYHGDRHLIINIEGEKVE